MHVPTAESDLNEPRALIRLEDLLGDQAGVAEAGAAIALAIGCGKGERLLDGGVVHQAASCRIKVVVILEGSSEGRVDAQRIIQRVKLSPPLVRERLTVGVCSISETFRRRRDLKRRVGGGEVAGAGCRV